MEGRGLKIALAVSLVVNVFIIGAVAGFLLTPVLAPPTAQAMKNPTIAAGEQLNPDDRAAFHQMLSDASQASGPTVLDSRLARRELIQLLKTEPFDRAGATAAMARARADDQQVRARLDEAVLDFAAKLSPQERAAMAEGFRRAVLKHWASLGPGGEHPSAVPPHGPLSPG
jgi:uncharacterized membrane protein